MGDSAKRGNVEEVAPASGEEGPSCGISSPLCVGEFNLQGGDFFVTSCATETRVACPAFDLCSFIHVVLSQLPGSHP